MADSLSRLASRLLLAAGLSAGADAHAELLAGPAAPTDMSRFSDADAQRDAARAKSLATVIGQDPARYCIKPAAAILLAAGMKTQEDAGLTLAEMSTYSPEQFMLAKSFRDFAYNSDVAAYYAGIIIRRDTWLCENAINDGTMGAYYSTENAIAITLKSCFDNSAGFCTSMADIQGNAASHRVTITEEIVHAAQDYAGGYFVFGYGNSYTHRGFDALHTLMTEAHAKTISAVIAADEFIQGDGLSVHYINRTDSSLYDREAVQTVIDLYTTHGRDAVLKDASLLYPVFAGIMQDEYFLHDYFLGNIDLYNENAGKREPDYKDLADTFDTIPGIGGTLGLSKFTDYRALLRSLASSPALDVLLTQFPESDVMERPLLVNPYAAAIATRHIGPLISAPAASP